MARLYPLLRSALTVLAGEAWRLILLMVFALGVLMPSVAALAPPGWKPGTPPPDTPAVFFLGILYLCWILLIVGPVGGYVAAMVAGRRYLAHGVALAVLSILIYIQEVITSPPGTQPLYFVVTTFAIDPLGVMFGAWWYSRRSAGGRSAI
jgi:hypothetical protein